MALNHYKLNYDRGLDVTVSLVVVQCTHSFSLSDWKVVQSRKRPKKVESMKEFLAQQNDFWGSIRRHAQLCRDWEYGKLQEKAVQLSLVRKKRVKDIRDRLKELGWTEASFFYYGNKLLQLPEVNKLEPLTPVEWAEIRPQLITWLQSAKEESVCHYRMNVFGSVLVSIQQALGGDTSLKVRPSWIDVAMLPAVRSLVESNNPDMSYDDLKTKFSRVLPPAIRKWSSNAVEELEQLARKELGLLPLSKPSCLPSIIFRCKVCHHRFRFDNALSHQHLYKEKRKEPKNICEMSPYDKLLIRHDIHPRNTQVLRVDFTVSRRVENLVRRVGQNPSRVTYHELCHSTVKVYVTLLNSFYITDGYPTLQFEHCLNTHLRKKETEVWTRVSARK
ncbi:hypothetical protein J3R82DRAFT_5970 [Butyriboletus roseoflavus]|nr:hypothetical protein J3R82DRAFT_5970 [Butyriboletus roseoflavus]